MPTLNQLTAARKIACQRRRKKHYNRTKHLGGCPQKKGVCVKVYITKPKKPNSALRKVAKVALGRSFKAKKILVSIPGQGHSLQKFSTVLVRGGRVRDIPGVRYRLIRGKEDFTSPETFTRVARRSFFGIKKPEAEFAFYRNQGRSKKPSRRRSFNPVNRRRRTVPPLYRLFKKKQAVRRRRRAKSVLKLK
jgi:small subunit ribosomal protein S12